MDNSFILDPQFVRGYGAAAAIVEGQLVKFASDTTVTPCTAATDIACGVALKAAASGADVDVVMGSQFRVKAGGTLTRGAEVVSDASGYGVAATLGNTTVNYSVGRALEGGNSGEYVAVQVMPRPILV